MAALKRRLDPARPLRRLARDGQDRSDVAAARPRDLAHLLHLLPQAVPAHLPGVERRGQRDAHAARQDGDDAPLAARRGAAHRRADRAALRLHRLRRLHRLLPAQGRAGPRRSSPAAPRPSAKAAAIRRCAISLPRFAAHSTAGRRARCAPPCPQAQAPDRGADRLLPRLRGARRWRRRCSRCATASAPSTSPSPTASTAAAAIRSSPPASSTPSACTPSAWRASSPATRASSSTARPACGPCARSTAPSACRSRPPSSTRASSSRASSSGCRSPSSARAAFYQDPCYLGRWLGVYDAPRRLAGKAVDELREFSRARNESECSGGGGLLPATMPATARAIAEHRLAEVREAKVADRRHRLPDLQAPARARRRAGRSISSSSSPMPRARCRRVRYSRAMPGTVLVVNPQSAGGKTERRWPELRATIHEAYGAFEERFTRARRRRHRADARRAARRRRARRRRRRRRHHQRGGQRLLRRRPRPIAPEASFGILPAGTGGDFIKTLGVPRDTFAAAAALEDAAARHRRRPPALRRRRRRAGGAPLHQHRQLRHRRPRRPLRQRVVQGARRQALLRRSPRSRPAPATRTPACASRSTAAAPKRARSTTSPSPTAATSAAA